MTNNPTPTDVFLAGEREFDELFPSSTGVSGGLYITMRDTTHVKSHIRATHVQYLEAWVKELEEEIKQIKQYTSKRGTCWLCYEDEICRCEIKADTLTTIIERLQAEIKILKNGTD